MLTLKDINEASFGKSNFSGYKPEDVDAFLDEVSESYKQLLAAKDADQKKIAELTAKNTEIQDKLTVLARKIDSYRKDDDVIKDAILSAQKVAHELTDNARNKAENIVSEAEKKAREMISSAKTEAEASAKEYTALAEGKKNELEEIKKAVTEFKMNLVDMYKQHLEHIDNIPALKPEEMDAEPKTAEKPAEAAQVENNAEAVEVTVPAQEEQSESVAEPKIPNELEVKLNLEKESEPPQRPVPQPQERPSRFADLEFGDGIDVTNHK